MIVEYDNLGDDSKPSQGFNAIVNLLNNEISKGKKPNRYRFLLLSIDRLYKP